MLCEGECGLWGWALARADWISKTAGVDWAHFKWSRWRDRQVCGAGWTGVSGHQVCPPICSAPGPLAARPCLNYRAYPAVSVHGNDDGVAKSDPGRQLLPAGALRGSTAPCVLVHEIIPDSVACQNVDLGLHVPVVAACLADPYADVGYGDQRLIFAQRPVCVWRQLLLPVGVDYSCRFTSLS